jgi:hypothetical protein
VVPAMTQRMVLDDKLRGDWRAETQREGSCLVRLLIRKLADRGALRTKSLTSLGLSLYSAH